MEQLGVRNTRDLVATYVKPVRIDKPMPQSLKAGVAA